MTPDQADLALLSGAAPDRVFGIELGLRLAPELKGAFDRGVAGEWFRFVDLTPADSGALVRRFWLTDAGMKRLAALARAAPRN